LVDLAIEAASRDDAWDLLIDLGRLPVHSPYLDWLDRADVVVIVTGTDAASVLHVHDRSGDLLSRCAERLGLVLVGEAGYGGHEIEDFTGMPVIGQVPDDVTAAAALAGHPIHQRRLARSSLLRSGRQIALILSGDTAQAAEHEPGSEEPAPAVQDAWPSAHGSADERQSGLVGRLARMRPGFVRLPASVGSVTAGTTESTEEPTPASSEQVTR